MAQEIVPIQDIVIIGGSYGGISIAHYLLKHVIPVLPGKEVYRVVIVSTASQAMCRPACPRALISDHMFSQDKLFVNIPKQFEQYPADAFRFVHGTVTELDDTPRTLSVSLANGGHETLRFHALVIATGTSTPSPLLGLNVDEQYLRTKWHDFRGALPEAKNIVIAGGGPAGIETAGELGEYLNGRAGWFSSKLANPKVNVTVVTSGSKILPALRPSIAQKAEQYLSKVGVTVIKNTKVSSVEPAEAGKEDVAAPATVMLHDGTSLDADLYIPATGTTPNTSFVPKELLTPDGRVKTIPSSLRVENGGRQIYAIGDCASYSRPAIHLMLEAVPVLGANIKRDLLQGSNLAHTDLPAERVYKEDTTETQMVIIGKSKGVGAAKGWALPSWLVWLIKRDYWLWTTGPLWSGKQWSKE